MSGVGRLAGRILLLAVVIGAVVAVVHVFRQEPSHPDAPHGQPAVAVPPAAAGGPAPSPAAVELLARIRSCSGKELEGVVDRISGAEALGLYSQLTPADRQAVFSAVPAPLLARKANELLGIPESSFHHIGKAGLLASTLVDAAMGTAPAVDPSRRQELCFATALGDQGIPMVPRGSFRPTDRKIYACMDAGPEASGEPGVLVRWSDEGTGALVYLHYLPLSQNRRWNHVFFEVAEPWPTGSYRVRLYRLGDRADLLAEGAYVIRAGD